MKCFECAGEVAANVSDVTMKRKDGSLVIFSHVKVNECRQCGEIYVPAESSEKIGALMKDENAAEEKVLSVPVIAVSY